MQRLNVAAFAASLAFALATPACATPYPTEPALSFGGAQDAQALFGASAEPLQLAMLSPDEMNKTQGAFSWLVVAGAAAVGAAGYGMASYLSQHEWSHQDFAIAIAQGAAIGVMAAGAWHVFRGNGPSVASQAALPSAPPSPGPIRRMEPSAHEIGPREKFMMAYRRVELLGEHIDAARRGY